MRTLTILISTIFIIAARVSQEYLPRTIYVEYRFETCEHIKNANLYFLDDNLKIAQTLGALPRNQKFTFTFFPQLNKFAPDVYFMKIQGELENGEPIGKYFAIRLRELYLYENDGTRTAYEMQSLEYIKNLMESTGTIDKRIRKLNKLTVECSEYCGGEVKIKETP